MKHCKRNWICSVRIPIDKHGNMIWRPKLTGILVHSSIVWLSFVLPRLHKVIFLSRLLHSLEVASRAASELKLNKCSLKQLGLFNPRHINHQRHDMNHCQITQLTNSLGIWLVGSVTNSKNIAVLIWINPTLDHYTVSPVFNRAYKGADDIHNSEMIMVLFSTRR